ncbi:MAG: oxidoreductase, partial [Betaproteobacteria bacterium]|nr:oxidoreductase [Betaproteobacteria bacterium]
MKVCVYGAGAVGGNIAVRMAAAKVAEVSIVARGAHLAAIRARGLTLRSGGRDTTVRFSAATDDASALPGQDLVIVGLKAQSIGAVAEVLAGMLAPGGCALFLANGIHWWWRYGMPGRQEHLPLLDPQGALWTRLGPGRALGGAAYSGNEIPEPGLVVHSFLNDWGIGDPSTPLAGPGAGEISPRLKVVVDLFQAAGLQARAVPDVRRELWLKLVRVGSQSAIAALTHQDNLQMSHDAELSQLRRRYIDEMLTVAAAQGWDLRAEVDVAKMTGPVELPHRASMLQDVLAGRPIEVEAQVGQLQAFA